VFGASVAEFALASDSASAYTVTNYAVVHLAAAARFSRRVGEIEAAHPDAVLGDFWEEIRHCSSACVMLAVAALEAYANEAIYELLSDSEGSMTAIDSKTLRDLHFAKVKDKIDYVRRQRGHPVFSWGERIGQAIGDLIELRDAVVHFKPERSDAGSKHAELSRRLKNRFTPSLYFKDPEGIFPRRWCCHSCTAWTVETCRQFGTVVETGVGANPKFSSPVWREAFTP